MSSRLPNAPLTEVVFEMHWAVVNPTLPMASDPGYGKVFDALSTYAGTIGFRRIRDFHAPYTGLGRTISRRFYKSEDNFPLLQIGPGVFAANDSVNYEWSTFKKMALNSSAVISKEYPEFKDFDFTVVRLELRYLDAFEEPLVGSLDLVEFINKGTEAEFQMPSFWSNAALGRAKSGRVLVETELRSLPGAKFSIDLASASKNEVPILRMESKVVSSGQKLLPKRGQKFYTNLDNWLTKAHDATSASFKAFIREEIREKFT